MNRRYRAFFSTFTLSLVLCVPLGITLVQIFTLRLANPFQSPYLCTASVLWSLIYGGALYTLWRLHDAEQTVCGILLYAGLIAVTSVWLNCFWR